MAFRDEEQVALDVARTHLDAAGRAAVAARIAAVLTPAPELHYYQGFHEVALNCASAAQLRTLALTRLRDFMAPTMDPALRVLALVPELLARADAALGALAAGAPPHWALPAVLTLFAHDVAYAPGEAPHPAVAAVIARVEADGLGAVLYLLAALLAQHRDALLAAAGADAAGAGAEPEIVHVVLSKAAARIADADLEKLFAAADALRRRAPLRRLRAWRHLARASALRSPSLPPVAAAEAARALARPPRRRLPARSVHLAVAVTVVLLGVLLQGRRPDLAAGFARWL